jgi:hypothetical protein
MKKLPDLLLGVLEERFPLFRAHQLNKNEKQMIFFSGQKKQGNNFCLSPLLSPGNTKGGRITVLLTFCMTGLELAV